MSADLIEWLRAIQIASMIVIVASTTWLQARSWRGQRFGSLMTRMGATLFALATVFAVWEVLRLDVPGGTRSAYIAATAVIWAIGTVAMAIENEQTRKRNR